MRFGLKDIAIVSIIGVLTGCYLVKAFRVIVDKLPYTHYIMGTIGIIAAMFIILLIRPLVKQESPD
jgi:hypothetical protein